MKIKIFVVFNLLLAVSCSTSDDDKIKFLTDTTIVYKTIPNIDKNLTSLDIYTLPGSDNLRPVVIWVHGGGWSIGDKLNKMDLKVPFFRDLGYVFVSVNYRLSPFPFDLTYSNRIKHPDHIIDIVDALKFVYNDIELYGGDKTNIVVLGHSAGAHLAALIGTNQTLLSNLNINPNHIKGIGSFDTQDYNINKAIDVLSESDLYINAFTDDKTLQDDASPYIQIDNSPIITNRWLFAERGEQERKELLNEFIAKLESKNISTTKIDANDYTHAEVNELIGDKTNTLMSDAIDNFLIECFIDN